MKYNKTKNGVTIIVVDYRRVILAIITMENATVIIIRISPMVIIEV